MGDGKTIEAKGIGTAILRSNSQHPLQLKDVLLVPAVRYNLLAVGRLDGLYKLLFTKGKCSIHDKHSRTIAEAYNARGL
jgi:hypothetical protein